MIQRFVLAIVAAAAMSSLANAHFVLIVPAASKAQNRLGDPQKIGPCGGVSANPGARHRRQSGRAEWRDHQRQGRHEPAADGAGDDLPPGPLPRGAGAHRAQLPPDPEVKIVETEKGPRRSRRSSRIRRWRPCCSTASSRTPSGRTQNFETEIPIPNISCPTCVLQVIEFMADHPGIAVDGGHNYHHCAVLNITADPSKPIDKRW